MFKLIRTFWVCIFFTPIMTIAVEREELGNLLMEDIPKIPKQIKDSMLRYQNTRAALLNGWTSKGGMIVSTRFGETNQLHNINAPGEYRKQITFFDEPVGLAVVSPQGHHLLFTKDIGGSEYYQIFLMDLKTNEFQMVTDGSSRNGGPAWSNNGNHFAYYSTKRNKKDWDLYLGNKSKPNDAKLILDEGGTWFPVEWSPDDSKLLVTKYVSINESYYFILNLSDGELTQVNPSKKKISYGDASWAPDGNGVFIASDEDSEFLRLRYFDLRRRKQQTLTDNIPWDIDEIAGNNRGGIAFTSNENGVSQLFLLDHETMEFGKIDLPMGVVSRLAFSPDGRQIGFVLNTPSRPGDSYSVNLRDLKLARWTYSEVGGLDTDTFATPSLIHYDTFDQINGRPRKIPAFYYRPKGDGPFPVLVRIHGGPEGQSRPWFSGSTQYFVNESGYAVIAPNVRGSAGYGKSYLKLDNGFKREDSVNDIGLLLEWIAEQPELDASKVAVFGGSYGGYMVLAAMTNFDDRIACGVDVVGISNFVTFLENTKGYRRDLRRPEYGDERDPKMREFLHRISPTTNAKNITKPLFVVQGLNDPRVPVTESEQMVREIRENGQDVWYLMAKDEGHGFKKKFNRDYYLNATSMFLDDCIGH